MPIRDLLLAILLIFNVYFAYTVYNLDAEEKEGISEIGYDNYATLYMFKEIVPANTFREILLPEIKVALKDGTISRKEWKSIKLKMEYLKENEDIDFHELYLKQMKQESLGTTLEKILDDLGDGVDDFGGALKQDLKNFVEKHKDVFNDKDDDEQSTILENIPENGLNSQNKGEQKISLDTNQGITL